jgi:1,2-phenylacetyl-CoA epoxidase PaaB subunit
VKYPDLHARCGARGAHPKVRSTDPAISAEMPRWRVEIRGMGKRPSTLGSVEAADERSAIVEAAKRFNITPARRDKIIVTRTQTSESHDRGS